MTGWPSGYGVRDTVEFVRAERARHPEGITVVTHARTVRTTARALDLEFAYRKDVRVEDLNFDHPDGAMPLLAEWARERPTLVVIEPPQGKSRRPGSRRSSRTSAACSAAADLQAGRQAVRRDLPAVRRRSLPGRRGEAAT